MQLPTIEVQGKAGRIVINADDVEKYRKDGYKPIDEITDEKVSTKKPAAKKSLKIAGE